MYRVLIVEDDLGIGDAVRSLAEKWGLQARCVKNFRDVMEEFNDFDPHLALLDITLPFFNGQKLELTKNEYRIVLALMEEKGKVVSREKLMERLWDSDSFVDENALTVNVNRLRKKPDGVGLTGFIQTKVGTGYMIGA